MTIVPRDAEKRPYDHYLLPTRRAAACFVAGHLALSQLVD